MSPTKMSKLTDFYTHKAAFQQEGKPIDPHWDQLEDQLLKEELLPELIENLKIILSKVKSPLMFSGSYDPNGSLSVSFTRNCISTSVPSSLQSSTLQDLFDLVMDEEDAVNDATTPPVAIEPEESTATEKRFTKAKSIGFSVSFRDGTIYHEKKAVKTWILALKKIGLETICNNRSRLQTWHRVAGQDVCIVERTETKREDGQSPQTLVDGFYVMTQLSNESKVNHLKTLAEFIPKLGIKVFWDNESDDKPKAPIIDEEASNLAFPIKEQFRSYLIRQRSEATVKSYISTLDNAVLIWIKKEVDEHADSVFSYTTADDVRICIEMLESSSAYQSENERKHHSMSSALNQYLQFLEEREKAINV